MYTIEKNNFFKREEKERTILFVRDVEAQFILNKNGEKIFEEIISNNDLKIVRTKIHEKFASIDERILNRDIDNIFNMLRIYGIVENENEKEKIRGNNCVKAVDEDEYNLIEKFIEENRGEDALISGPEGYYVPQNIRAHVMNNQEYYYVYVQNGKIESLISVTPNLNQTSVINIMTLIFEKSLSRGKKKMILEKMVCHIEKSMINPVNKFRITYYSKNKENEPFFLESIKELGFKYENILKREYKDMDLYLYEYPTFSCM